MKKKNRHKQTGRQRLERLTIADVSGFYIVKYIRE